MNLIDHRRDGDTLYLIPKGRIDSGNAAQADSEITEILSQEEPCSVVIDADGLAYISSAGLRVVLRVRKEHPELKIVNTSSEIYEIMDMTGFTEMMPVEKGYRRLSVDGCEVIGQGANGIVYRLDPDTIIKVYIDPDALPDIQRERDLARRAFVLGIPTAIPYDVVRVGSRYGSVFELLNARSFSSIIAKEPERLDEIVGMYTQLLRTIHSTEVAPGDMPDQKRVVTGWVEFLRDYLDSAKWEKLERLVREVPDDLHMIHGDYHVKNVMLQNGEALLIDMDTLAHGDPIFEFASIFNAYCGFSALDSSVTMSFLGIPHETALLIWQKTIRLYFETDDPAKLASVEDKSSLIGYARLMRRLIRRGGLDTEDGKKTVAFYRERIESLLEKIDSLDLFEGGHRP